MTIVVINNDQQLIDRNHDLVSIILISEYFKFVQYAKMPKNVNNCWHTI